MKKVLIISSILFVLAVTAFFIFSNVVEQDNLVVGVVILGTKDVGGWNKSHYDAFLQVKNELGVEIIFKDNVTGSAAIATVEDLISQKAEIIFLTSYEYYDAFDAMSKKYPDVKFLNCSGKATEKNSISYFGRMYQARYLSGIVAGMTTKTNQIGFIASMKIPEVFRSVNAFTQGVMSVNPDATVNVTWVDAWSNPELETTSTNRLIDEFNVDVITNHLDTEKVSEIAEQRGIKSICSSEDQREVYPDAFLAACVWKWSGFYTTMIEDCMYDTFKGGNYWEGLNKNIIDITFASDIESSVIDKVNEAKSKIIDGSFDVFFGPIYDNEGNLRIEEGTAMSDDRMLNEFDWYVKGVNLVE